MMSEQILYERSTVENGEGQVFRAKITQTGLVCFEWQEESIYGEDHEWCVFLPQDALGAATAILKHFEADHANN